MDGYTTILSPKYIYSYCNLDEGKPQFGQRETPVWSHPNWSKLNVHTITDTPHWGCRSVSITFVVVYKELPTPTLKTANIGVLC